MKKLFLLFSVLVIGLTLNAQSTIFYEDFQNNNSATKLKAAGWIVDTVDLGNTSGSQHIWYVNSYSGNYYLKASAYGMTADTNETWAITPAIDLSKSTGNVLSLDVCWAYPVIDPDTVILRILYTTKLDTSNFKNSDWKVLKNSFSLGGKYVWNKFEFNLDSLDLDSNIYLAFVYNGGANYTTTYQVDSITVKGNLKLMTLSMAYTVNDTTIALEYEQDNPNFVLDSISSSLNVNFTGYKVDDNVVYLYTDKAIEFDNVPDTITDALNQTSAVFYAGIAPIDMLNTANANHLDNGITLTAQGYVTANDNYNQIWIQDDTLPKHGILVYDPNKKLPDMVEVGDLVTVAGTRSEYKGETEIAFGILVNKNDNVTSPITPTTVSGSTIGFAPGTTEQTEDDSTIEPYEGLLIQVQNAMFLSGPTSYYEYIASDDGGTTNFVVDDDIDYHYQSYDTISFHGIYNITGVLTYGYGFYRLNPLQKGYNGLEYVRSAGVNDVSVANLSVYPNPVTNELNITADNNIKKVEIYNAVGQAVKSINISGRRASIGVADLKPGVYMVRVYTNKGISTSKIIMR